MTLAMCIETPLPSSHSEMSPLPSEPHVPFIRCMILFILYCWRLDKRSDRISARVFVFLIAVTKAK